MHNKGVEQYTFHGINNYVIASSRTLDLKKMQFNTSCCETKIREIVIKIWSKQRVKLLSAQLVIWIDTLTD